MIPQNHGKIINTASMAAKRGVPYLAHYTASKWAVVGFSASLALEVAKYNITVNCVCPGLVQTGMQTREIAWEAKLRGLTEEQVRQEYVAMTPLGRLEQPEDVAKLVSFLASEDSDFMTGQAINITGGIETR
jgi:NAD(P)-dependent dehydrogenase (short-subunit alcohol dehydrogenase family)